MKSLFVIFIGIICFAFVACNSSSNQNILTVDKPCAVFYYPDSLSFEKLNKEMDTASWADYLEDNQTYFSEAHEVAESTDLYSVTTEAAILNFIKKDGSKYTVKVDTLEDKWGLFLFDGIHDPKQYSMTDMAPAIDEYLDKKE